MKSVHIKTKLEQMGVADGSIVMGDFDLIGEVTAKRQRSHDDANYKKYGSFYRANYERGILIYYLIRQFNLKSVLEIGFGRGYATLCAARAFYDSGVAGKVVSIEPNYDENHMKVLSQVVPQEWLKNVQILRGKSQDVLTHLSKETFDLVYIDGDHSYVGTKLDWEGTKDKFNKFLLFDDYHLPTKEDKGIQCSQLINEIDWKAENCLEPELLIMDRRMFVDDRGLSDNEIDYGQVLLTKNNVSLADNDW